MTHAFLTDTTPIPQSQSRPVPPPLPADLVGVEPGQWLPLLTRLLDDQCATCTALEALSAQQTRAIGAADTDLLLRIIGQRQTLVDRIADVNTRLGPFRTGKDALLAKLQPAQRDGVVQRVGRIAALVESVRARDDQDRISVERMRGAVADELAGLARGRGAAAAYAASGNTAATTVAQSPRFQDRQG